MIYGGFIINSFKVFVHIFTGRILSLENIISEGLTRQVGVNISRKILTFRTLHSFPLIIYWQGTFQKNNNRPIILRMTYEADSKMDSKTTWSVNLSFLCVGRLHKNSTLKLHHTEIIIEMFVVLFRKLKYVCSLNLTRLTKNIFVMKSVTKVSRKEWLLAFAWIV